MLAAAKMQKLRSAGRAVEAPTAKAMTSVRVVMVMATPAWRRLRPILLSREVNP